jgi:uncharacterized protein involved in response to NO
MLSLGFRPFFLLAGILACLWMPLWMLVLTGHVALRGALTGPAWHGHEMVFGFVGAGLAGFLLTAVRNWTGLPTPSGARLVNLLGGGLPPPLAIAIDVAFLPAVAAAIGWPIVRARMWRNLVFVPLLCLLGGASLCSHLGVTAGVTAVQGALDLVLVIVVLVTGRIVPLFTGNALGAPIRGSRLPTQVAIGALVVVLGCDLVAGADRGRAVASLIAGAALAVRGTGWRPLATVRSPILWVLHLGHAWLPIGLLLRGAAAFLPAIPPASATHALTVGAIATLILGMMSRVSLGHTGRPLVVSRPIAVAFGLLGAAALVRTLVPAFGPASLLWGWLGAGALWTAAFALFAVVYAPILRGPRVDGKPG